MRTATARATPATAELHVRASIALVLTLLAQGCIFFVYAPPQVPRIDGVLRERGRPVAGVPVRYYEQDEERVLLAETTTADDGTFHIERRRHLRLGVVVATTETSSRWDLCFGHDETCWRVQENGHADPPRRMALACDAGGDPPCTVSGTSRRWFRNQLDPPAAGRR